MCVMLPVPALGIILIPKSESIHMQGESGSYNRWDFPLFILLHIVTQKVFFFFSFFFALGLLRTLQGVSLQPAKESMHNSA